MDRGNLEPQARQRGRVGRVGVHDPAHMRFRTIETRVHGNLAGRFQGPFQDLAVKGYEHHVFGLQNLVGETARGYQDIPSGVRALTLPEVVGTRPEVLIWRAIRAISSRNSRCSMLVLLL